MNSELKQHLQLNLQWLCNSRTRTHEKKCCFESATNKWVKKKNEKNKFSKLKCFSPAHTECEGEKISGDVH